MSDVTIAGQYPASSAGGCCYVSKAQPGTILEDRGDGDVKARPERVLITHAEIEYEGLLCLGERTVRHFAHLLNMVDEWRVDKLLADARAVVAERDQLAHDLADALVANDVLRQMEVGATVYMAADGNAYTSADAAKSATFKYLGIPAETIPAISESEAPLPAATPEVSV